ncbi:flagellar protein FlgN [Paenibacillus sp.]|uniref:flagellar protein FlgN n=1 Tax=Paenibacillus sp. TaxID=58172 RepID=UPI002D33EFC1|nr:flagellar protein FlgN [Paenibacillus sp.]HZG87386.1 flagellar protein FlgN [Paenibacillus sp.]
MTVAQLLSVLERMTETHEELIALAEQKKEALIRNNVDEVSAIVNRETRAVKVVDTLLKEQADATNAFFRARGFQTTRAVTVTELSRMVTDPQEKKRLLDARDRLTAAIAQLKTKNELNQKLIEQSISYINYTLDLVLGPDEEPIYHNPASQATGGAKRMSYFDSKA